MGNSVKLFIFVLGVLAVIQALNFSRFCYSKGEFMSDRELIDLAIGYELKIYESVRIRNHYEIEYSSIADFMRKNPNCCAIRNWWGENRGEQFLGKIFGFYRSEVSMKFKLYDDWEKPEFFSDVYISECGEIAGRRAHES